MGSNFQTETMEHTTPEVLKDRWAKYMDELTYMYGHDCYNGTFSTCRGLQITDITFNSDNEAEEWLCDNTEKWGEAVAVKVLSPHKHWLVGGWCAE